MSVREASIPRSDKFARKIEGARGLTKSTTWMVAPIRTDSSPRSGSNSAESDCERPATPRCRLGDTERKRQIVNADHRVAAFRPSVITPPRPPRGWSRAGRRGRNPSSAAARRRRPCRRSGCDRARAPGTTSDCRRQSERQQRLRQRVRHRHAACAELAQDGRQRHLAGPDDVEDAAHAGRERARRSRRPRPARG